MVLVDNKNVVVQSHLSKVGQNDLSDVRLKEVLVRGLFLFANQLCHGIIWMGDVRQNWMDELGQRQISCFGKIMSRRQGFIA